MDKQHLDSSLVEPKFRIGHHVWSLHNVKTIKSYVNAFDHATSVRYPVPLGFLSKRYFSFKEASYKLMVDDILGILNITPDKLKVTNNGTPIDLRTWIVNEEEAFSTTR